MQATFRRLNLRLFITYSLPSRQPHSTFICHKFDSSNCRTTHSLIAFRSSSRNCCKSPSQRYMSKNMATKTITLDDFDVYGFDIDHTLAEYKIPALFELVHSGFTKYLVQEKGYHKDLLEPFSKWKDFCFRGLVFDVKRGNLLKVGADGTILRASHGTRFYSNEELNACYPNRHWERTDHLLNNVDNIEGSNGEREIMIFDNMFDMIGTVIIGRLVDILDRENGKPLENYAEHFKNVLGAYNDVYSYLNFATGKGGYFPVIKDEPSKYIDRCSDQTLKWLKALRSEGKAVFFLTSSFSDYGKHVLTNSLGEDWIDYCDISIFRARKPTFFNAGRPFFQVTKTVDGDKEGKEPVQTLEAGQLYTQGNHSDLVKFLEKTTGKENPKILYFGDSIRSDIFPARSYCEWSTVAIIDEITLEDEAVSDDQPPIKRQKVEDQLNPTKEYVTSSLWGSFFYDPQAGEECKGGERSMNTLWGVILNKYATIAIPSIHYMAGLPKDHKFSVFTADSRKSGFSPCPPSILDGKA